MKYILVTGGVISGIGKGLVASSIGALMQNCGLRVTSIKIDPYINIDAGTFSPFEHGEVFVLDDGAEVDLDLGNYERFLDITLHKDNNITTGKIYQFVIDKERRGDYLGKTVQVVPHITDAIQDWIESVSKIPAEKDQYGPEPEICIIELGGTIGDMESLPFIEAFRQFQYKVKQENFCNIHVSLVPIQNGEHKTKPAQNSVQELRGLGLQTDVLICRSPIGISESVRSKLSSFLSFKKDQVIGLPDVNTFYKVPLLLKEAKLDKLLCDRFRLTDQTHNFMLENRVLTRWKYLVQKSESISRQVTISLVGKYTTQTDTYVSMIRALDHAASSCDHKPVLKLIDSSDLEDAIFHSDPVRYHHAWQTLCGANAVIVAGGFGSRGIEGKINAIQWARTNHKPFLGICLGLECAVIEFARNVLDLKNANSSEFAKVDNQVVIEIKEQLGIGSRLSSTMRLGKRKIYFKTNSSIMKKLYGDVEFIEERHRHRYEINTTYATNLEKNGMKFTAYSEDDNRIEIMELDNHPYFIGVQFHPEYLSRPHRPSPPYLGLILASIGELKNHIGEKEARESLVTKLNI